MTSPAERSAAAQAALAANAAAEQRKRDWQEAVRGDEDEGVYGHGGNRGTYMVYKVQKLREQNLEQARDLVDG